MQSLLVNEFFCVHFDLLYSKTVHEKRGSADQKQCLALFVVDTVESFHIIVIVICDLFYSVYYLCICFYIL